MAQLGPDEMQQLEAVERIIANLRKELDQPTESFGSKMADKVATLVGSWKFLISQLVCLFGYMAANVWMLKAEAFDPYPFIALNLILSFQAAFTAPIILMAQNRADKADRRHAGKAYTTIGHMDELLKAIATLDGIDPAHPTVEPPPGETGVPE